MTRREPDEPVLQAGRGIFGLLLVTVAGTLFVARSWQPLAPFFDQAPALRWVAWAAGWLALLGGASLLGRAIFGRADDKVTNR